MSLISAYLATRYEALGPNGWAGASIGQPSPELDQLMAAMDATSGIFMTAWNPFSLDAGAQENQAANMRLGAELDQRGQRHCPHRGVPALADWQAEEGYFVLDLALSDGLALAEEFGQNAIVHAIKAARPMLYLTHHFCRKV